MTVFIAIGTADWKLLVFKKKEGCVHVIRKEADIYRGRDKLHRDIVAGLPNRDGRVLANFSRDTIVEAVIQPLAGLWLTGMILRCFVAVQRHTVNATVERGVVGTHVIPQKTIELFQRGDRGNIQRVQPALLECSKMALYLTLVM